MRLKNESGQAYVISVLFLTVLLGMAAAAIDVGSWYNAQRKLQATVDASALAGAQKLPRHPGEATALASEYATKNGGGAMNIALTASDTIKVTGTRPAKGFFTKLFGIDSITVKATATAKSTGVGAAKYVAPIVVDEKHPKLQCDPNPCAGPTELNYQHLKNNGSPDGAGNFGFINLSDEGGTGTSTLGEWILNGYQDYLPLGDYDARTGNPFSSGNVGGNLDARVGDVLLFPIYRKLTGGGTKAKYEIIGWVGFRLSGMDLKGNKEKLFGEFTEVIWDGLEATGGTPPDFGVRDVTLVE